VALGVTAILLTPAALSAQSLAEVARKEAERRGTAPPVTKTYTNGNLTPDFTTPPPPPAPEAAPAVAAKADEAPRPDGEMSEEEAAKLKEREEVEKWGVTPRDQQELPPGDDHNEEFWRNRSNLIKARLATQNANIQQLRERMAATRGSSDDERDVLERTFARAEADLKHINAEWVRFERQARDRKVPESWWR
jgi:hypothetical protein